MADDHASDTNDDHATQDLFMMVFLTLALYNVVELNYIVFRTFQRRSGLYFWTFLVATWGIVPYVSSHLIRTFSDDELRTRIWVFWRTLTTIGWPMMVTGQSLVLYSRLHILVRSRRVLRAVLSVIIINGVVFHVAGNVLGYLANVPVPEDSDPGWKRTVESWSGSFHAVQKTHSVVFFVQEVFISALYIYQTVRIMRGGSSGVMAEVSSGRGNNMAHAGARRKMLSHLVGVNVLVLCIDIAVIFANFYQGKGGGYAMHTALKPFAYSLKLKLEFDILNQLIGLFRRSPATAASSSMSTSRYHNANNATTNNDNDRNDPRPTTSTSTISDSARVEQSQQHQKTWTIASQTDWPKPSDVQPNGGIFVGTEIKVTGDLGPIDGSESHKSLDDSHLGSSGSSIVRVSAGNPPTSPLPPHHSQRSSQTPYYI